MYLNMNPPFNFTPLTKNMNPPLEYERQPTLAGYRLNGKRQAVLQDIGIPCPYRPFRRLKPPQVYRLTLIPDAGLPTFLSLSIGDTNISASVITLPTSIAVVKLLGDKSTVEGTVPTIVILPIQLKARFPGFNGPPVEGIKVPPGRTHLNPTSPVILISRVQIIVTSSQHVTPNVLQSSFIFHTRIIPNSRHVVNPLVLHFPTGGLEVVTSPKSP